MNIKCRAYNQYQKHLIAVARLLACSGVFRKLFADCVPVLWLIALANTVGLQFETKDRKMDVSVGASASIGGNFAVKFEKQKGFVFDVKFLLGLRLEANWGKKNEK